MLMTARTDYAAADAKTAPYLATLAVFPATDRGIPVASTDGQILSLGYAQAEGSELDPAPGIFRVPKKKKGDVMAVRPSPEGVAFGVGKDSKRAVESLSVSPELRPKHDGGFPPLDAVIPTENDIDDCVAVILNPELLRRACESVGCTDTAVLLIPKTTKIHKPVIVMSGFGSQNENGYALLMRKAYQDYNAHEDAKARVKNKEDFDQSRLK